MKIIIFAGPTISEQEAKKILDAVYLPPAGQSDVMSAVYAHKPDVIGIIDGVMAGSLSVWHSEILYAINNGAAVYGSSSIGALRAVELGNSGMTGIGEVYEKYKKGELNDDDEVVMLYGNREEGYPRLSEPMVNLRATFRSAVEKGVIDNSAFESVISITKSIYYPERRFPLIFQKAQEAGISADTIERLKNFVSETYVDIQKSDAKKLLNTLRNLPEAGKKTGVKEEFRGVGKRIFNVIYNRDRKVCHDNFDIPLYNISNYAGIMHPEIEDVSFHSMNRMLVLLLADILKVTASEEDIDKESRRFRNRYSLKDKEIFCRWLSGNDITAGEFRELMRGMARIRRMHRWFMMKQVYERNTKAILDELRLRNEYEQWKIKTAGREKIIRDKNGELSKVLTENLYRLLKDHIKHTGFRWSADIPEAAGELGFEPDSLKIELAKEKIFRNSINELLNKLFP